VNARFTSVADRELREAIEFYEAAENGLGNRFLDEVEATLARIVAHPLAWTPLSPRTRRCRTHRFPYGLFYQIRAGEIVVLSVMDLRRDPKRWRNTCSHGNLCGCEPLHHRSQRPRKARQPPGALAHPRSGPPHRGWHSLVWCSVIPEGSAGLGCLHLFPPTGQALSKLSRKLWLGRG